MSTTTEIGTATTWTIDSSHSSVEFSAKHLMITTVRGRFSKVAGEVRLDPTDSTRSSARAEIDATTLDTRTEQRDQHLKSGDFLDVENHPSIVFQSTRVDGTVAKPGDKFKLVGSLTIRGVTREVVLDATFDGEAADPWGGTRVGFNATTTIDRRDFGLTWNVGLEAGGILVSNDVKISLEIQATKAL